MLKEITDPVVLALVKRLEMCDWYYYMSDDSKALRKGKLRRTQLNSDILAHPNQALMKQFWAKIAPSSMIYPKE